MEKLYEEIFGRKPVKKGTAYELIVGAVLKCLNKDAQITHNVFFRNPFSGEIFQIDNLHRTDEQMFVESKDYSGRNKKVGRGDVQKLAGALCVLKGSINKGLLTSATDFTNPAKQFTQDFLKANAIPIDLLVIRQSIPADTEGTIRKISININIIMPDFQKALFSAIFHIGQAPKELGCKEGDGLNLAIDCFYKKDGSVLDTISNLTSKLPLNTKLMLAQGEWKFDEQAYIYIGKFPVPIERVEYKVPFINHVEKLEINAGKAAILVRSIDGEFYKIISVEDLRKISVTENGTYGIKH
ncbi:MAG: restriction endonuclease [Sedimentisphaerales bacterium]|jgi:hypothetical protein